MPWSGCAPWSLARLFSLRRWLIKEGSQALTPNQQLEKQQLLRELFPNEDIPTVLMCTNMIHNLQTELHRHEEATRNQNISRWKHAMKTNVSALSKWLRAREAPGNCAVRTAAGTVAMDVVEETDIIHQFWVDFWDNHQSTCPPLDERCNTIRQGVPATQQMVQFPTPTGIELCRYAQSAAGAAGCDGWCGQELRFWPLPVWQLVSQLISEAIDRNQIPKQFLQARMVCIPKSQ